MSLWQRCPNCNEPHDVSVYVSGQRVLCERCALRFQVVRRDVASGAKSGGPGKNASGFQGPEVPVRAAPAAALQSEVGVDGPLARSIEISVEPTLAAGAPRKPEAPAAPPAQLPGFELLGLLGRGGMGEVWRARQTSLGREVAVKILSRDLARDPDFVRRFELEAAALTSLAHPHVVAIIDRGRHDGLLFFAMELVEGRSLRERLGAGRLSVFEAARVMGQVLAAIGHAHQKGIVHRDLKPENVLLDRAGAAKVADFGLAAMRGLSAGPRLTRSAVAMGTLSYMAPEQRKDAHGVDQRADLFSAGVVLYEVLTGDVPAGRYEPASRRCPDVPRAVDRVIDRALALDPRDRFATALEMGRALEHGVKAGRFWERWLR